MKKLAEEIGDRVRKRREKLDWTRAELARLTEISEDALGLIERGESTPRVENLIRLAEALRVPLDALASGPLPKPGRRSLALDRLVAYLGQRPEEDISMVSDIAKGVLGRAGKRPKKAR